MKELFPELSGEKLEEAEINLQRYAAFLGRLYDRLLREGYYEKRCPLTREEDNDTTDVGR